MTMNAPSVQLSAATQPQAQPRRRQMRNAPAARYDP